MKVKNKILATVIPLMILFTILMNIAFGMFFEKFILQQEDNQINIATNSLSSYINERLIKGQGNANDWGQLGTIRIISLKRKMLNTFKII